MATKLKVTQVRSIIGSQEKKHKRVMTSLGFTKHQATLYKNDNPQIRGMLHKVRHLVEVVEIDEKDIPAAEDRTKGYSVVKGPGKKTTKKEETVTKEPDGDEA
jgi:large subunit ribosomal protein L30